jgi:N-methylhydantoinase B
VVNEDLSIDGEATREQRDALRAARPQLLATKDDRFAYVGEKGMRRILRLSPNTAEALGLTADQLVELKGRHPAPLRAWVRLDAEIRDGCCPLDELGRRILGVDEGNTVILRALATAPVAAGLAG